MLFSYFLIILAKAELSFFISREPLVILQSEILSFLAISRWGVFFHKAFTRAQRLPISVASAGVKMQYKKSSTSSFSLTMERIWANSLRFLFDGVFSIIIL